MDESKQKEETDPKEQARRELKRAFVLTSFGYFEEALEACERAAQFGDDDCLPRTIQGAILTASGRPLEAMKSLGDLRRRHKEAILPALYLAEACFMAGRHRRGWKILDSVDEEALEESPWADFARQLRTTWEDLGDLEELPEAITVPFENGTR